MSAAVVSVAEGGEAGSPSSGGGEAGGSSEVMGIPADVDERAWEVPGSLWVVGIVFWSFEVELVCKGGLVAVSFRCLTGVGENCVRFPWLARVEELDSTSGSKTGKRESSELLASCSVSNFEIGGCAGCLQKPRSYTFLTVVGQRPR